MQDEMDSLHENLYIICSNSSMHKPNRVSESGHNHLTPITLKKIIKDYGASSCKLLVWKETSNINFSIDNYLYPNKHQSLNLDEECNIQLQKWAFIRYFYFKLYIAYTFIFLNDWHISLSFPLNQTRHLFSPRHCLNFLFILKSVHCHCLNLDLSIVLTCLNKKYKI